jgi:hypothetical protein
MVSWPYPAGFRQRLRGARARLPAGYRREWAAHTNSSAPSVVVTAADSSLSKDEVAMLLGHIIRLTDTAAKLLEAEKGLG